MLKEFNTSNMRERLYRKRGFSFIELMVALVCLALIVAAIMRLFATGYRQLGRTQRNIDAQLNAYLAAETITQQLRAIAGTGQSVTRDTINPFKCSSCHAQCFSTALTYGAVLQGKITNCTTDCHSSETPTAYNTTTNKFTDLEVESFVIKSRRATRTVHPVAVYITSNVAGEKNRRIDFGADLDCNTFASGACADVHAVERRSIYTRAATAAEDTVGRKVLVLRSDYGGGQFTENVIAYAVQDVRFEYVRGFGENWQNSCYSNPSNPATRVNCKTDAAAANVAYVYDVGTPVQGAASDAPCITSNPASNYDYDGNSVKDTVETLIFGNPLNAQSPQGYHPLGFRLQGIRVIITTINDDQTQRFTVVSFVRPRILSLRRFGGG